MPHPLLDVFSDEGSLGVAFKNKSLKKSILNYLDSAGTTTIADLSKELNISTPKISSIMNELIQDKLVQDYGKIDSTGGRRASMYGLVSAAGFFLGVDIKRYYINIGLLDFNKNLVIVKEKIPYKLENSKQAFTELIKCIKSFVSEIHGKKSKVLAAGINISGRINNTTGYSYSFFNFQEEPLARVIESEIGIKTFLENDSRSMAYGEFCNGAVTTEKNVLFVNIDYGIGLGILIDSKVYYGKSGFSGEFGHIPLFDNDIICHCGKKGCLETEASGMALLRLIKEKITQGTTSILAHKYNDLDELKLADIIEAAKNDDMLSIEMIAQIGEKIGRGLAVLTNIFNTELIILGGALADTEDYIRLPIKSALNKYSLSLVNNDTKLITSKLGERSGVMGGCLIARNKIFSR